MRRKRPPSGPISPSRTSDIFAAPSRTRNVRAPPAQASVTNDTNVMRITSLTADANYAAEQSGAIFSSEGKAMTVESISAGLGTGFLVAAFALALHIGHCAWFAVNCF